MVLVGNNRGDVLVMRVYLSCVCKNGLLVSVVSSNGVCIEKRVEKATRGSGSTCMFSNLIDAYTLGFTLLKSVVEHNSEVSEVIIETRNKSFLSWLKKGYCPHQYSEDFLGMLTILDYIPLKYQFTLTDNIVALNYAKERYLSKVKLVGFDSFD